MSSSSPFSVIALAARDPRDSAAWLAHLDQALRATGRPAELLFAISDRCPNLQAALAERQAKGARFDVVTLTHWYDEVAAVQAALGRSHARWLITLQVGVPVAGANLVRLLDALENSDVAVPEAAGGRLFGALSTRLFGTSPGLGGRWLRACRREALERIADRSVPFPLLDWYALWQGLRVDAVPLAALPREAGHLTALRASVAVLFLYALLDFAKRPLRLFGLAGAAALGLGLALTLPPVIERLLHARPLADDPALLPGLLLTALGVQCGVVGLVAELLISVRSHLLGDGVLRSAGE